MPGSLFNITLKENGNEGELLKAKETAKEKGGTIRHEYTLIKGFTVEFPSDVVHTLASNDDIHVEKDGESSTQ